MKGSVLLLSVSFTLFLLLGAFFSIYYDHGPKSIYASQRWSEEQQAQVDATLDHLNNKEADIGFYTEKEQSHLDDVRRLITVAKALFFLLLAAIGVALWCGVPFKRPLKYGALGTKGVVVLIVLLSLGGFTRFWNGFHRLFFPQGNYLFAPESTLITLFPESFFYAFAFQFLLATTAFGLVALAWSFRPEEAA